MAQDEGRISRPKRCWASPKIRPTVPGQVVRESMYIFAAVASEKGLMTSFVLPAATTSMMNLFLKHVSEAFAEYFIVMQLDQAAWHHSKTLVVPENIRLLPQPLVVQRSILWSTSGKNCERNIYTTRSLPLLKRSLNGSVKVSMN